MKIEVYVIHLYWDYINIFFCIKFAAPCMIRKGLKQESMLKLRVILCTSE